MDLLGIGPIGAARILADVGDISRFADRNRFPPWAGTAPPEASSGEQVRHRLSRAGNRKINHMLLAPVTYELSPNSFPATAATISPVAPIIISRAASPSRD